MGVAVTFGDDSATVEVTPGEEAVCAVRVQNTGAVVDGILLDVVGDAAEWVSVEPAQVNLLPGASESVRLTFRPPRSSALAPGEVPFALRAMSSEDPNGSRIEESVVDVGEFSELEASLVPKSATGRRSARYRLVVENRGNRDENLTVEAADPDVKLSFRLRPEMFSAEPGVATYVRLSARPRKTFFRGPNRSLPFDVVAQPEDGDPVTADGVLLERQILPGWLLPALGLALLAAVLILALWLTVLRPIVHSAATAAANADKAAGAAKSAAKAAQKNNAPPSAPPSALKVTVPVPTILTRTTELATATGSFGNGPGALSKLVWTSSSPKIARVSQAGVVTAHRSGSVTITATTTQAAAPPTAVQPSSSGPSSGPAPPTVLAAASSIVSGSVTVNVVGNIKISTTALAEAARGRAYAATLDATGGTGAFTWSVSGGALPPGLTVDPSSGMLTGTPTSRGIFSFTVHVADSGPPTQFATAKLTVTVAKPLAIDTSSLPGGTIGARYAQPVVAFGGTVPYGWLVSPGAGSLPPGLRLDRKTGKITGTPKAAGTSNFTVQVTDAASPGQSSVEGLSITVAKPLALTTTTLPDVLLGKPYSTLLNATGGSGGYAWTISKGALPPGLSVDPSSGLITGRPTKGGIFSFTVQVADSASPVQNAASTLTLAVVPPLAIDTSSLPDATAGVQYSQSVVALGGTLPLGWTISPGAGSLPGGLQLDPKTGAITGTPNAAGTSSFTVQVTDAGSPSQSSTEALSISVVNPLTLTTLTLPTAVLNSRYTMTLAAFGGAQPYTWSVSAGSLPAGLTLSPGTGAIGGTPTAAGQSTFTIEVTDSKHPSQSASRSFLVSVVNGFQSTTSSLVAGKVGVQYSAQLTAVGGVTPYVWSLTGTLPPGLSLSPSGAISGTPTSTGIFPFTVQIVDSSSPPLSVTADLSITVVSPLRITTTSLRDAVTGVSYSQTVQAAGGTAPYAWSITSGSLPRGLTLSQDTGIISGTALTTGTSSFTVSVTDSDTPTAHTASLSTSISVVEQLSFSEPTPPDGVVGLPYQALVPSHVSGGSGAYTWSITSGAVPGGLILDPGTGTISGTIDLLATQGPDNFTITVADASDPTLTASQQVTIKVVGQLSVGVPTLSATALTSFSADLAPFVSGGVAPYTFTAASADGLSVNPATGVLSGTPDATCNGQGSATVIPGTSTVKVTCPNTAVQMTVTVKDADGTTATAPFTVGVSVPPFVFTPVGSLPAIHDGDNYNQSVLVNGVQPTGGYGQAVGNVGGISFSTSGAGTSGPKPIHNHDGLPCNQVGCSGLAGTGELHLDSSNGQISGSLDDLISGQKWTFNVQITDVDPLNTSNSIQFSFQLSISVP
jgi:hypothetical protein